MCATMAAVSKYFCTLDRAPIVAPERVHGSGVEYPCYDGRLPVEVLFRSDESQSGEDI
jgi:hypothetical protein